MSERSESQAGLWEAVRRALGRIVGSARVHEIAAARLSPPPLVLGEGRLAVRDIGAGRQEESWAPQARSAAALPPRADPGGGGTDLASVAAIVGLNAALPPEAVIVHAAPPVSPDITMPAQDLLELRAQALGVWGAPTAFLGGAVRSPVARLPAPAVSLLPTVAPHLPKRPAFPAPKLGRGEGGDGALRFADVRVRAGMSVCAEVPLVRGRRPAPPGLRVAQAFAAERRQLAHTVQADLDDVVLLGVYPLVPVAAVRRLALEEDGLALSLWLKPEALAAAANGKSPRLATLIVGRQRSTGRMIQAVA